jgi:hypothetical protein
LEKIVEVEVPKIVEVEKSLKSCRSRSRENRGKGGEVEKVVEKIVEVPAPIPVPAPLAVPAEIKPITPVVAPTCLCHFLLSKA